MARHRWSTPELRNIQIFSNEEDWDELRNSAGLVAHLNKIGADWVSELNTELKAEQVKRKQPVEDGYEHHVVEGGSRARLYVVAETARAQAHEAKHSSILKRMKTAGHEVDVHGAMKNPTQGWLINDRRKQAAVFLSHVKAFTNA